MVDLYGEEERKGAAAAPKVRGNTTENTLRLLTLFHSFCTWMANKFIG